MPTPTNPYAEALAEIDAKLEQAIATLREIQARNRQRALDEAAEAVRRREVNEKRSE